MRSYLYGASAEYALHSLLIMIGRKEPVSVRDLARFQRLPERFLAKLFTRLKRAGLVNGIEGIHGGFALARSPEKVSVMDVLEAADPNRSFFECAEIRRKCELFGRTPPTWSVTGPCRIHLVMQEAERAQRRVLTSKSLADLGGEFEHKAPNKFMQDTERWFQQRRKARTNNTPGRSRKDGSRRQPCSSGNRCKPLSKDNVTREIRERHKEP
jgi:Rrf2 family protein